MALGERREESFEVKLVRLLWSGVGHAGILSTPCCGMDAWHGVEETLGEIEDLWVDEGPPGTSASDEGWIPIVAGALRTHVPAIYAVLTQHQTWEARVLQKLGFVAGQTWKNLNSGNQLTLWLRLPQDTDDEADDEE